MSAQRSTHLGSVHRLCLANNGTEPASFFPTCHCKARAFGSDDPSVVDVDGPLVSNAVHAGVFLPGLCLTSIILSDRSAALRPRPRGLSILFLIRSLRTYPQ